MDSTRRPGDAPFTTRTPRVSAAVKLHRRKERDATGLFLAEGPQAVREAMAAGVVREVFVTQAALARGDHSHIPEIAQILGSEGSHFRENAQILEAGGGGTRVSVVTGEAMAALAETVTPQGVVAVCELVDVPLGEALAKKPRLVAVAVDIRDPGNAGTILRTADAAGAGAVIFTGDSVDPHNGKCVRASAGSLFHVDVVRERETAKVLDELRDMLVLATSGRGETDLFELEPRLKERTAWLFGGEAHGLPDEVLARAERVRVPIYGFAESLNLAAAAAVCLYASARAHRSAL